MAKNNTKPENTHTTHTQWTKTMGHWQRYSVIILFSPAEFSLDLTNAGSYFNQHLELLSLLKIEEQLLLMNLEPMMNILLANSKMENCYFSQVITQMGSGLIAQLPILGNLLKDGLRLGLAVWCIVCEHFLPLWLQLLFFYYYCSPKIHFCLEICFLLWMQW